jgi:hypothetical protein
MQNHARGAAAGTCFWRVTVHHACTVADIAVSAAAFSVALHTTKGRGRLAGCAAHSLRWQPELDLN